MLHLTDEATAYKAFRVSVLRELRLDCQRFEFCPEVTAKLRRLKYRIHEVPITYNARGVAEGKKIRFRDGLEALWTLLKISRGDSPVRWCRKKALRLRCWPPTAGITS